MPSFQATGGGGGGGPPASQCRGGCESHKDSRARRYIESLAPLCRIQLPVQLPRTQAPRRHFLHLHFLLPLLLLHFLLPFLLLLLLLHFLLPLLLLLLLHFLLPLPLLLLLYFLLPLPLLLLLLHFPDKTQQGKYDRPTAALGSLR